MDDFKLVRLVIKGINPVRVPFMHPDQRYSTAGGSLPLEDTGHARDLLGGGLGCCSKPCSAKDVPQQGISQSERSVVLGLRNPDSR